MRSSAVIPIALALDPRTNRS